MTINYNLIFKDGLTDAAIDEAIEFTRIKIYRDIDDIVKRRELFLDMKLGLDYWLDFDSGNVGFEIIPPRKVYPHENEQDDYWRGVYDAIYGVKTGSKHSQG